MSLAERRQQEEEEGEGDGAGAGEEVVQIRLGDKCYSVCKRKLIEQSDYFRALYRSGMREAGQGQEEQLLRGGLSALGLELVLDFINTSCLARLEQEEGGDEEPSLLEELVEAASYLQVTPLLHLLLSQVRLGNCLELHRLAQVYGLQDLHDACVDFMAAHYHQVLQMPDARPHLLLPHALQQHLKERRMRGTATLVAIGDLMGASSLALPLGCHPQVEAPWSMLRYDEEAQRWLPLANNMPPDLVNVRGYGSAMLDNYLFIVGGYRLTSQEISAAHCYNPCLNEWSQLASMNQKRSNFKLLAVNGKLYAIGGQSLSNVECYNPEHDWWNFVASMPNPLAEFSACECKGKIYVIGGYTTRDRNMNILQYCPTSDSWTNFELCDVHVRKQQMLSVEETIYLVGGCIHELGPNQKSSQSEDVLTVQSYNIDTKKWLYLKENTSKSGLNLTCTLHNDGVYIMSRDITLSTSLEHRVFLKYNIFTDSWESLRRFPAFGQNMLICSMYLPDVREA
ncbi:kelch-like protein 42 [Apteryx mantelli]|uniref:Kelch-like protein 42 n=1 Tax=Apteryx mantelli TaxID=2696672 RepID=A0A8B7IYK4_9AVES|nr:PREDICTED: kelch-like protein 42 [Apteryx mantelli mantelli]XP_013803470.1 PREDICTED: kelch-like protein 42 [Apteryx mantelli mantelli]XP_025945203.1 kelch-like protein 42 [Apteryx rowi]